MWDIAAYRHFLCQYLIAYVELTAPETELTRNLFLRRLDINRG
jgi:hypothetical protein